MPNVFRQLYYHAAWATKNREPALVESLRRHLHEAVQEKCRRLGCRIHGLKAMEDHVHLAFEIPPTRAVAFVLGQIKGASTHALNQVRPESGYWQEGYGVVTFRAAELEKVKRYIETQEERHRVGALSPILEKCEGSEEEGDEED